ncbi:MAG: tryptophanase [Deltaproteobacteria bacterium]|jgi:tyrosine phenol-lyase|nr:tryptophanase [Deltaproteobacteria bacterium]
MFKTLIEPFRIKTVEPIRRTTPDERRAALAAAGNNVFLLKAEDVLIDLLTDSGTGAMSAAQWGALLQGDESYAGSRSYFRFEEAVRNITHRKHIIPTHQGRAAERILFGSILKPGDLVPNNTHFDTTRANVEVMGATALDLVIAEGKVPSLIHPFKGNLDLARLERVLSEDGHKVPLVMVTVTNNSGGGQPVSLENIRGISALCKKFDKPLFIDACRFAENAWFIKQREPGQSERTPLEIAQEMFSLAQGATMSAKKDGLANIGGFLALDRDDWAEQCRNLLILTEGFPTYGGLAGYDLEAIAQGLKEVVDEDYLRYRIRVTEYVGEALTKVGVPILLPTGGHAVYLDARAFLPHVPPLEYPGIAIINALYLDGGVRGVEIGTVMFGQKPDGSEAPAAMDLVRLAIPRRVYTQSHMDYVVEAVAHVYAQREKLRGWRMVHRPKALRHFTATFEPMT